MYKNPQNKYFVLVFLVLTLLWWIVFFKNQKTNKELLVEQRKSIAFELASVQQDIDERIIDTQKEAIRNQLSQKNSQVEKALKSVIQDTSSNPKTHSLSSWKYQLWLLSSLYEMTKNVDLLPALFQLSLDDRNFDDAVMYLDIMIDIWSEDLQIDPEQYMYALMNSREIDFTTLQRFKTLVDAYTIEWTIPETNKNMYYAIMSLVRSDIPEYEKYVNTLRNTDKASWAKTYDLAQSRFISFVDAPEYYLIWLLNIGLFKQWRYRPVQHISRDMITQDSTYLLAYQLNAYASMMLWDRSQAIESFDYLKNNDEPNKELYTYLSWIAFYHQERYSDAVLSFKQLKENKNNSDVLRYLFLSYLKLDDKKWVSNALRDLINVWKLTIYDYFSIFDAVFYSDNDTWLLYIDTLQIELDDLLTSCYAQVTQEYVYLCLYWKAWLHRILWDTNKAYGYLRHTAQWFPDKKVFELLWDMALDLWDTTAATKRYIQALTSTSVTQEQSQIRSKITWLLD